MQLDFLENNLNKNNINNEENFEISDLSNFLSNNIENNLLENDITAERQNEFLNSAIGKAVNLGINLALRAVLPDLVESQVIEVKDVLMKHGLKEGIKTIANSAIDLGKSAIGIFTGKFDNISQVQNAVKSGGILDSTSDLLGKAIDDAKRKNLIDSSIATMLKRGKNMILESVNNNIEDMLTSQIKSIEKINKYSSNWNTYYEARDFDGMQREFKKLKNELNNVVPLENTIKQARQIENLHEYIKNNGHNFDLSEQELQLAHNLV